MNLEEILTSKIHTYGGIVFDRSRVRARWPRWDELWEDVYFYVRCFDDIESMYHVSEALYRYYRVPGSICNREDTGVEHLASAQRLAERLEAGETLDLGNAASRKTFQRYLRSRRQIEEAYLRALDEGACRDFHSFTQINRGMFYRLDEEASPRPV